MPVCLISSAQLSSIGRSLSQWRRWSYLLCCGVAAGSTLQLQLANKNKGITTKTTMKWKLHHLPFKGICSWVWGKFKACRQWNEQTTTVQCRLQQQALQRWQWSVAKPDTNRKRNQKIRRWLSHWHHQHFNDVFQANKNLLSWLGGWCLRGGEHLSAEAFHSKSIQILELTLRSAYGDL